MIGKTNKTDRILIHYSKSNKEWKYCVLLYAGQIVDKPIIYKEFK